MLQEKKHTKTQKKDDANSDNDVKQSANTDTKVTENKADFWHDKQYSDIVYYLFIAIFIVELIVAGVAFFYGIIHAIPDPQGGAPRFQFPWLAYALAAILAPAGLLLILRLIGFDVFQWRNNKDNDSEAWQNELPDRLKKAYMILKNAPTIVLLIGVLLLGIALIYVDGAISVLFQLSHNVVEYLPWIIGALVFIWCINFFGRMWFAYRSKRLEEEYAFRREIFERTGQILVDRGTRQLPPPTEQLQAIEAATIDTSPIEPTTIEVETVEEGTNSSTQIIDVTEDKK